MLDVQGKIELVIKRLAWLKERQIWPNGKRYLWTDAHGVLLLVSLHKYTKSQDYLTQAESLVKEVKRVLGRTKGYRIGQDPDREGQYFHYLTKWMFALNELGKFNPEYKTDAIKLVKDIHPHFCIPGVGIWWKMKEDLSGPAHGYGLGGLDFYDAFSTYRSIDSKILASEIHDVHQIVLKNYKSFHCTQDLGLGESLWMASRYKDEEWAKIVIEKSLKTLDMMYRESGYFVRDGQSEKNTILAFGNHGVSVGLQSVQKWPDRVTKMQTFFENFKSNDKYDTDAITHVMYCNSVFPGVLLPEESQ